MNSVVVAKFGGSVITTGIGSLILTGVKIGVCGQLFGNAIDDIPAFTFYSNDKKKNLLEFDINKAIRILGERNA